MIAWGVIAGVLELRDPNAPPGEGWYTVDGFDASAALTDPSETIKPRAG